LVRTLRVVPSLPIFHSLRTMLNAIMGSAEYLLWAMVLLFFVMFMFAVAFMQGVSLHSESGMATEEEAVIMETFFPSLAMTLLTLFMSISGGLNWWELVKLFLHINPFFGLLFAFYISLMVLALLNIVTGIFVNDALEQSQLDRDLMAKIEIARRHRDMERLTRIFAAVDVEGTGRITLDQFLVYMEMKEVNALFSVMGLEISNAVSFFEALDVDGSGDLVIEEFVMGCMNLRGSATTLDMATFVRENTLLMDKIAKSALRLENKLSTLQSRLNLERRSPHQYGDERGLMAETCTRWETPVASFGQRADLRTDREAGRPAASSDTSTSLSTCRFSPQVSALDSAQGGRWSSLRDRREHL